MDNNTPEPTNLVINTYPTPKEQLIAGAIALALTAGTAVVLFGGMALVGKAADVIQKRRNANAHAAAELNAEATE